MISHARHEPGAVSGAGTTFVAKLKGIRGELLAPEVQENIVQKLEDQAGAGHSTVAGRQAGVLQSLDQGQEGAGKKGSGNSSMCQPGAEDCREQKVEVVWSVVY